MKGLVEGGGVRERRSFYVQVVAFFKHNLDSRVGQDLDPEVLSMQGDADLSLNTTSIGGKLQRDIWTLYVGVP